MGADVRVRLGRLDLGEAEDETLRKGSSQWRERGG